MAIVGGKSAGLVAGGIAAAMILLPGCARTPKYERPALESPATWRWKSLPAAPVAAAAVPVEGRWWEVFNDPKLNEIETLAHDANQDLRAAVARIDEARSIIRVRRSDFFPQLTANPSAMRSQDSENTFRGGGGAFEGSRTIHNTYATPLNLSFEADVFGRIRKSVRAQQNRAEATVADFFAIKLSIQSDVAANYFLLHALDAEIEVLEKTRKLRQESLALVESKFKFGVVDALDLSRAKTDLFSNDASLADVKRQRELTVNIIAILCGKAASDFVIDFKPLVTPPPEIPAGFPSTLVQRRPDVTRAELFLQAFNEDVGVAKTAFFPRFSLTASSGFQSQDLSHLFTLGSAAWNFGAGMAQPILTGGRNKAEFEGARARYNEAAANYRQQVLVAFKDVEDSLIELKMRAEEAAALAAAVDSAREVTKLATTRYQNGLISFLDVVDAQRQQLEIEQRATRILGQRLVATVRLIRALGGGWDAEGKIEQAAAAAPVEEIPEPR